MARWTVVGLALLAMLPAAAQGAVTQQFDLPAKGNGIVLGPDGHLWVALENGNVVRVSPAGQVVGTFPVGAGPTSLATGPGGRVWVSVTGADKLTWIDATSASPTTHDISTAGQSDCGPIGIVSGGNGRMYFSLPNRGGCAGASRVGHVSDDGAGMASVPGLGSAFDLEVAGGKLFIPDFDGNVVRRTALDSGLTLETSVTAPDNPNGIAADGAGNVWVTLWFGDGVGRIPTGQNGGAATVFKTPNHELTNPLGIALGHDGAMYAASTGTRHILARIDASGGFTYLSQPSGLWQIVAGPDQDFFITDNLEPKLHRVVHGPPRATTGDAGAISPTGASVGASVDPRGNATKVVVDYGATEAYGQTSAETEVPAGVGPVGVQVSLEGLVPGTTYHYRVRATNELGEAVGTDRTFTTAVDNVIPVFVSAKLTNRTYAVDLKGAAETLVKSAKPKKGTTFVYRLSEAARVLFKIEQKASGRKVGKKCRKPSRSNRTKPKCTRLVKIGTFAQDSPAGETKRKFSGKLGKKALRPGSYLATLTAKDAAGNGSKVKRLSFKIVKP